MPSLFARLLSRGADKQLKEFQAIADRVGDLEPNFTSLSDADLKGQTALFRERYANGESLDDMLPEAFAAVREASRRTLGLRHFDVQVIAGISSLSYLCAQLRTTWQDVYATSAHGRDCDVVGVVRAHARTFLLTGGDSSVESICTELAAHGLGDARVSVGERLSYEDERITVGTAADLAKAPFDPLAVMLIERPVATSGEGA